MGIFKRTYKTKDGKDKTSQNWHCEFYFNGQRFCQTTGTSNKQEAQKICLELKEKVKKENTGQREYLFEEALHGWYEEYLRQLEARRKKTHKNVQDSYQFAVKSLMDATSPITSSKLFIGRELNSIRKSDLMDFVRIRRRNGVKDSSIARELACMSSVFAYAELNDMCEITPPISLVKKTLKKSKPKTRYLSEEEYDKLLLHASDHLKTIIIFTVETGMRKEEYLSLRWKDVNLVNNRIHVRDTKNGKDRNIPISKLAKEQLHKQLHNNINKSEYVFYKNDGSRIGDIKKTFNRSCQRAGIKDLTIHDLRKTFGSWRLQGIRGKKLSLNEVSKLLGHSSLDMTRSTYV